MGKQLVYFWVDKFRNLENAEFNFGSEYIFSVEKIPSTRLYSVNTVANEKFVENFYKLDNNNAIENITAIVGNNASGKSNFLFILRYILNGEGLVSKNYKDLKYALIYKENGRYFIDSKDIDFSEIDHKQVFHSSVKSLTTIFYLPIIDMSIYPLQSYISDLNNDIDISSNWLLFVESERLRGNNEEHDMVEYHKWQDTFRQVCFLNEISSEIRNDIEKIINIPDSLTVFSHTPVSRQDSLLNDSKIPEKLRDCFKIMLDKFYATVGNEPLSDNPSKDYFNMQENESAKTKQLFLEQLIRNILGSFNLDGLLQAYSDKIPNDGILKKIENSNAEEAFVLFMNEQKFIDSKPILDFWENIKILIDKSPYHHNTGVVDVQFRVKREDAEELRQCNNEYVKAIDEHVKVHSYPNSSQTGNPFEMTLSSTSFINLEWSELSSGEKTYLNLFSRFYYAKELIAKKSEIPSEILILIDEGELGFHLQWQRDYIYNLTKILPLIFTFKNKEKPSLQIIFTTHSPISLSDIPDYNIVYLKKDEETHKTRVLSGKNRPDKSFAANVHTLMAHSFYLDSFVGKFAEEKINNLIKQIKTILANGVNIESDRINKLKKEIEIIDEPILKGELSKMLNRKLGKNEEILRLEQEKALIEKRLDELKLKKDDKY